MLSLNENESGVRLHIGESVCAVPTKSNAKSIAIFVNITHTVFGDGQPGVQRHDPWMATTALSGRRFGIK